MALRLRIIVRLVLSFLFRSLSSLAPRFHCDADVSSADEDKAIRVLETRLHKAPGLSIAMLKEKIFGRFESDIEFQLVMLSAAPLYAERFNPDLALEKTLEMVVVGAMGDDHRIACRLNEHLVGSPFRHQIYHQSHCR